MEKQLFAQLNPAATTEEVLYQVPQGGYSILSFLNIANTGASTVTFRISISKAGASTDVKDYLYYDIEIETKDTFKHNFNLQNNEGLKLEAITVGDIVRVWASTNELAFNLFGREFSV